MKKIKILLVFTFVAAFNIVYGQEAPKTLFPYPQAPDTISSLESRSNYIISHFWDKCDLSKPIKDEEGLEKAFQDYAVFFQFAHRQIVLTSINDLMNKAQSNPKNFMMLARIAEKSLYDVDGVLWSDEAYLPFAEYVVKSSKIKNIEKLRYKNQIEKINENKIGAVAQQFEYTDTNGSRKKFNSSETDNTLLFFNDPDCEDCRILRLRLSTDMALNKLIEDGKLQVLCIYPGEYSKEWAEDARRYSDLWEIGASEDADTKYDLRLIPNIYILDKDKKIIMKNATLNDLHTFFKN